MAAISLIEVNTEMLERDIRQLRQTLGQARSHMKTLKEKMDAMNSMWEGPSNTAVRNRFQADYQQMLELCNTLDTLLQTLTSIRQSYDSCEDKVYAAVNALRI